MRLPKWNDHRKYSLLPKIFIKNRLIKKPQIILPLFSSTSRTVFPLSRASRPLINRHIYSRFSLPPTKSSFSATVPFRPEIFDPQYEFSRTGWGEAPAPTQSICQVNTITQKLWPYELGPVLVLSIRRNRMDGFIQRMGPWMKHMKRFPCTDGRGIQPPDWLKKKKITQSLSPGQIGCYDSHVRIWQTIAAGPHPVVTVLEDDVDFSYLQGDYFYQQVNRGLQELNQKNVSWDFLSWGYGPQAKNKNLNLPNLSFWKKPNICQGFFAYTLTQKTARLLIKNCFPYQGSAVDMWFYGDFLKKNSLQALCLEPPLCFVIDGPSETTQLLK